MKNMKMDLKTVKEATLRFYKAYYAEHRKPPSVKLAWTKVEGLTKRNFYVIFKGGQAEACRLSGIPVPEDRIRTTSKAREEKDKPPETPTRLEEELAADKEEARLEEAKRREAAGERAIKARNELLELKAMKDSKKVIPYLKTLEPEITAPFFEICRLAELDPRKAWVEAVGVLGETWEEWGRAVKADGEEPHFKGYAMDVIETFMPKKRLELALGHHRGETYSCKCSECGLPFEYEEEKEHTSFSCPDGHRQHHGGLSSIYPCPVCKELGRAVNLFYDRSRNILHCKVCGFGGEVRGESLNPKGTKAGTFRPQIAELEEKVKSLKTETAGLQRLKENTAAEVEDQKRGLADSTEAAKRAREELAKWINKRDAAIEECVREQRRAEAMEKKNDDVDEKVKILNSVALVVMDPERADIDQLRDFLTQVVAAIELRKKPGHMAEAMKTAVEARDHLLKIAAGGRYILREEADKRLKEQLARQRGEFEVQLKLKDHRIASEVQLRETAERERKTQASQRDEDMKKVKKENSRLRDEVFNLKGELSDKGHREQLQRLETPSDMMHGEHPQRLGTPSSTSHLKLIKRGGLDPHD
jgi:transcription elongation factor Elf1